MIVSAFAYASQVQLIMARQESTANVYDGLPLALTAADFDAPDAAGGTYLFERLLGWGAAMRVRLRAKRVALEVSAPPASAGARRLFFSRSLARTKSARGDRSERVEDRSDAAAKAPIRRTKPNGACLSFVLTEDAVEVALELPAKARAERGAIMALLGDRVSRGLLVATIHALPHPFVIGRAEQTAKERTPVQYISPDGLLTMLTESSRGSDALWIGWHVPRSLALAHAATFGGEMEGAMLALGEFFRDFAWSPSTAAATPASNRAARGQRTAREHSRRASRGADPEDAGHAEKEADEGGDREAPPRATGFPKEDAPTNTRGRTLLRSTSSSRGVLTRGKVQLHSTLGRHLTAASRPPPPAPSKPGRPSRNAKRNAAGQVEPDPFDRGDEVHVLAGPFEGRIGVVQELDGKGHARVLLGLLATRIPLADLSRGPERRALASSHRKART